MNENDLKDILIEHSIWIENNLKGKCADLRNADLRNANLRYANLQNADLRNADLGYANLQNANLQNADLRNADLQNADLQNANLRNANLRNADLRNADLDFSSWPLWCGSENVKIDDKIMAQLINHILAVDHPLVKKLRNLKTLTSISDKHPASKRMWYQYEY